MSNDSDYRQQVSTYAQSVGMVIPKDQTIKYKDHFIYYPPEGEPQLLTCRAPVGFITSTHITAEEWNPKKEHHRIECEVEWCTRVDDISEHFETMSHNTSRDATIEFVNYVQEYSE